MCGSFISEDRIYLGTKEGHRMESNNIKRYKTGMIIEIEYEKEAEKVTVRNIIQKTQSVTYIKTLNSLPLHFVVSLSSTMFTYDD